MSQNGGELMSWSPSVSAALMLMYRRAWAFQTTCLYSIYDIAPRDAPAHAMYWGNKEVVHQNIVCSEELWIQRTVCGWTNPQTFTFFKDYTPKKLENPKSDVSTTEQ